MGNKKTNTDHQALYRKYRSKSLAEIVGQSHVTNILERSLKQGRVAHAYLLTGPRGVGKTSIARILAHEINELPYDDDATHLDIIEIDAASNNGVEDVRDLRDKVQIAPVSARKKVYIIDEVHMLSKAAFNALLKTLEEPPAHIVFILATTDVDKLPATIISRTQRYAFRAISPNDAAAHLRHIATNEHIEIDDDALALIAERGGGSFRDSISLLDQLANLADESTGIHRELAESVLGLAPQTLVDDLLGAVERHDTSGVIAQLSTARDQGISSSIICEQLLTTLRGSVADKPILLPLLDQLIDVQKSPQPDLKLLTVLAMTAQHGVKPAALTIAAPEISAPIAALEKQATKEHPKEPVASAVKPVQPTTSQTITTVEKKRPPTLTEPVAFDWNQLVGYIKEHYVALSSVISKCGYEIHGNELTIYCGNNFYKKKLDDAKYSVMIHDSIKAIGVVSLDIETIPTGAPLKDSQAAAVAAIMGGGEEVSVEAV